MNSNTYSYLRVTAFVCAVAGVMLAGPVSADEQPAAQHVVRFSPANLDKDSEVASLYARLQAASRDVCSSQRGRDVASLKSYRACYSQALGEAVNEVNQQTLTALHNAPSTRSAKNAARAKAKAG